LKRRLYRGKFYKKGASESADGGTLFLDEIGKTSLNFKQTIKIYSREEI